MSIGGMPRGVSSITEYLSMFEEYFTSREMVLIRRCPVGTSVSVQILFINRAF